VRSEDNQLPACLALEVPAYVAFYKSPPDFLGQDVLTIEVRFAGGRTEIQKITVSMNGPGPSKRSKDLVAGRHQGRAPKNLRSLTWKLLAW
jgi:hypothetical protein